MTREELEEFKEYLINKCEFHCNTCDYGCWNGQEFGCILDTVKDIGDLLFEFNC